jgi:hypothetical protein
MAIRKAVFNPDILTFDITRFLQALPERHLVLALGVLRRSLKYPIVGVFACACAATGHAAAPPI